jgi:hypothetical protein
VLILAPTRELALQSAGARAHRQATAASARDRGVRRRPDGAPGRRELADGAQIVSARPAACSITCGAAPRPGSIRTLVLDEADEMLSMGFARSSTRSSSTCRRRGRRCSSPRRCRPTSSASRRRTCSIPEFVTLSGDHVGALSITHFVYMVSGLGKPPRRSCASSRSTPRERDHLLQHARTRPSARGELQRGLRRRLAERRPAAGRAREGHVATREGTDPVPRRDRRRGARHRHLAPHARHQLRLPARRSSSTCTARAARGARAAPAPRSRS